MEVGWYAVVFAIATFGFGLIGRLKVSGSELWSGIRVKANENPQLRKGKHQH